MSLIVPDNDTEWKEFYAHARAHRLVVRKCAACGLLRYPPTHACPWCMALGWSWREVSGRGTIYSYEIVHHAIQPGFRELTPYAGVPSERARERHRDEGEVHLVAVALAGAELPVEEEAVLRMHLGDRPDHHDDHREGGQPREEPENEADTAEELEEADRVGDRQWKTDRGQESRRALEAVAAEPPEDLLRTVGEEDHAQHHPNHGDRPGRSRREEPFHAGPPCSLRAVSG